ncbi:MAG: T9SS type A sorting domain-containing protein [Candidatus Eisenbacteria sp.]|nr:T9SS type A sorting domain-containing protein [Candidatus Eisenbacteria bacterium]
MRTAIPVTLTTFLLASLTGFVVLHSRDTMPPTLDDFVNGASPPFGTMTVQVDIAENDSPTQPGEASVFYSTNAQTSWTETLLSEVPGYVGGTWEGSFPVTSGDVHYYFMVHDDSAATFSSPVNSAEVYPPTANLTADPGDEPAGDAVNPDGSFLDLNGARFGYSASHFYATLSNVSGSWPLYGGLFGPWYIYSAAIANPDATGDVGFALVYANVPLMLPDGLYAVDITDSSFTRIGDVDYTIQGGDLHLRCDLADLYAHPGFGTNNPSGFWGIGAGTATVDLSQNSEANDITNGYAFYHRTEVASVSGNARPVLSDPGYQVVGRSEMRDTAVRFFVTYTDSDGHLAVDRNVVVDGVPMAMGSGPEHEYAAGVLFELEVSLTDEDHVYFFSFNDGEASVQTEPDTIYSTMDVASGRTSVGATFTLAEACPNPFTSMTEIAYSVPVFGALVEIVIYDVSGRLVRDLVRSTRSMGSHVATWDGRDETGRVVASGVYFVRMETENTTEVRRLVFVR